MTDDIASTPGPVPDIEARLRHALAAKAGAGSVSPADWGDFAGRLASSTRRRQRALVGAAALALGVGAAGGYFGEAAASPGAVAGRATGQKSTSGGSAASGRAVTPSASGPAAICNGAAGTSSTSSASTSSASNSSASASSDIGSATRVFIRTTADGVTVRAYENASSGTSCVVSPPEPESVPGDDSSGSTGSTGSTGPGSGSTLMPLIPAGSDVTVELSDDDAVGQGSISGRQCVMSPFGGGAGGTGTGAGDGAQSGSSPSAPPQGADNPVVTPATTAPTTDTAPTPTVTPPTATTSEPAAIGSGAFGVTEGDPVWWVGVEVGSEVTSVAMTFPDGSTDQMAPVDGVAVLAHRVSTAVASADTGPYEVRGTLQIFGPSGTVVSTVTLPQELPGPVPVPAPVPLPSNQKGQAVSPGVQALSPGAIVVCEPPGPLTPQAQSSASTEKR